METAKSSKINDRGMNQETQPLLVEYPVCESEQQNKSLTSVQKPPISAGLGPSGSDFVRELEAWYLNFYTADSGIGTRKNKMVDDIYVPVILKDDFKPREEFSYQDVPRLLHEDRNHHGRVAVVRGEAGMGKTTFVKKLCHDWATGKLRYFQVVIAVPLRYLNHMQKSDTILVAALQFYATHYLNNFTSLKDSEKIDETISSCMLNAGNILFILDGFDEYDGGNKQIDELRSHIGLDPNFRAALVLTTPPAFNNISLRRYEFRVEGFNPTQIGDFVRKWISEECNASDLIIQLEEKHRTELAKTPLMLEMMCDIWEMTGDLPGSMRQLFDAFAKYLEFKLNERIHGLERSRHSNKRFSAVTMSLSKVISMFSSTMSLSGKKVWSEAGHVAYHELMSKRNGNQIIRSSSFSAAMLSYLLDVGLLCDATQFHRGHQQKDQDRYVLFKHKAFQEYLAGLYVEHMLTGWISRRQIKISNRSEAVEFMGVCRFISQDTSLENINLGGHIDVQNPDEWCAVARSLPSISIHICQNNFSEPTSKAEIDDIVICHIDLDTANSLRSWINCNSISSLDHFVINALHVQDSEDGFKSLQSVLEVMVEVTKVEHLYIFLPLHCVSQRLSSHNAKINFVQCVQSIQAEYKRVIINGSQSTSTTVVYQDIQKWLFGSYLYLVELKIEPGDVITVINNIAELNENKDLILTRNDLSSDDYETICLECQHIQMGNSLIGLGVQPKTDLTNNCVEHLIDLMIQLINYEKTKGLSIQFIGVNNFVKSEHLLEYLFNKVKDIIEVNELNEIWITLDDCGLDQKHCETIYNFISQFKRLPNNLWVLVRLNYFTVEDGNDLKRKLNDLFKDKSVYKNSSSPKGLARIINNRLFKPPWNDRSGSDKDVDNLYDLLVWLGYQPEVLRDRTAKVYKNSSSPTGLALIINNRSFKDHLKNRLGSEKDVDNLNRLFVDHGYQPEIKWDRTGKVIVEDVTAFAKHSKHTQMDSAMVAIMTHGEYGILHGVDENAINIGQIVSLFSSNASPNLRNKPKCLIIQACRGKDKDEGDHCTDGIFAESNTKHTSKLINLPCERDVIIAFATTPGYVAWRHSERGSWFIETICDVFRQNSKVDHILELLTKVNDRVGRDFTTADGYKQTCETYTRLTKKFYLFPEASAEHSIFN